MFIFYDTDKDTALGRNSSLSKNLPKSHMNPLTTNKGLGYMSETIKAYQLVKISSGQWAGNELLLFPDTPIPFSIITSSKVEALEITKKSLMEKFDQKVIKLYCLD